MLEPQHNDKLNKHDKVYHQLTYDILTSPKLNFREAERTVVHTMGVFGNQVSYDITDNSVPFSQTKPIHFEKQLLPEITGFIRNETNLKWYLDQGMTIWTKNAFDYHRNNRLPEDHEWAQLKKDSPEFNDALKDYEQLVLSGEDPTAGDLGNFYPKQWRSFEGVRELEDKEEYVLVDQLDDMITNLQEKPTSRYHIVSAWNPVDVKFKQAALAPCHILYQAYRYTDTNGEDRLDLKMHQRSADHLLGVPFNAPQYSLLNAYIAEQIGAKPGEFIHSFGDLHVYVGQDNRASWYSHRPNLRWLQNMIKEEHPLTVKEELEKRLPPEIGTPGYDHVPYLLKQLAKESKAQPPRVDVNAKPLDEMLVEDFDVKDYDDKPEKVYVNDNRPQMAA